MESELEIVRQHMGNEPVNVAAIFSDLGVGYEERVIDGGESGWIECQDGDFNVVVNVNDSRQRKRFTAAHELAHYLMHRDLLCKEGRLNRHTDRLFGTHTALNRANPFGKNHEAQANKMAAQIIMPASRITALWNECKDVSKLAERFDVSKAAMEIRLKTLNLA